MSSRKILVISCLLLVSITAEAQQAGRVSDDPWEGFADIHVHQMANLGFGGSIIWGAAWGPPEVALRPIPANMRRGHDTTEVATHGNRWFGIPKTVINGLIGDVFRHGEEGYQNFSSWPSTGIWTHQQVYEDWLFRAYQGGLRLMVMLAVNSEDAFGRGENQISLISKLISTDVKAPGRTGNDMEALEWQIRAAYLFQDHVDQEYGGPGKGWYRIVRDPQEASEVIKSGKLAVILGTELQHLFNCDIDRPACDRSTIVEGLDRLEAMGVNYVFPIHHKLNQFGGPAMFQPLNSGPMKDCPGYRHQCSAIGLTEVGRFLIEELTARGMLIDTEHLSWRSFNDTMAIVEARKYPVLAGHVVPFDLARGDDLTERAKTKEQIRRILAVGGIVAPMLGTSAREYEQSQPRIPITCHPSEGGSADQWANAYLFLRDLAGGGLSGPSGRIAIGSDWNGFAGWPGPHEHCDKNKEHQVDYPINLPAQLVPDAIGKTRQLLKYEWPAGKFWDYNKTGVAHVGLLPDFFENVRLLGLNITDLEPVYRSARGVVNLWETARKADVPWDWHHLRWTPQSPFDVLDFNYWDTSRNVSASDGLPPICRSRSGHLLGFEQNGKCVLVEPSPPPTRPLPEKISVYHDGRCLDIADASYKDGAKIVQNPCHDTWHQLWQVREVTQTYVRVVSNLSGKCLAVKNSSTSEGAIAIQETCNGKDNQIWNAQRSGNTFNLVAKHSNLCLEVRDQSRKDGAAIQQAKCTCASNQKWSIDSRRKDDFERLYQADKKRIPQGTRVFDWLDSSTDDYPIAVAVDGSRQICMSTDGQNWIGIVAGSECVGKTYDGAPVTTSRFQRLYQAR